MVVCILCDESVRGVKRTFGRDECRRDTRRKSGQHQFEQVVGQRVGVLSGRQPLGESDDGHAEHADPEDVKRRGGIEAGRELRPLDAGADVGRRARGGGLEELEPLEVLADLWNGAIHEHQLEVLGMDLGKPVEGEQALSQPGAALAHRDDGRLCVALQPDGDLLYTPGALWTAAHHRIPLLFVVCNNRTYGNDEVHQEVIARARSRPVENRVIGIRLEDPPVDFAAMARGFGVYAEGPIQAPPHIGPALARAVQRVKEDRQPALVDVVIRPGA